MDHFNVQILRRDLRPKELEEVHKGFDQHALDRGVLIQGADRFGFVAMAEEKFIGCSSGLAYKNGNQYNGWFYLTDLYVSPEYRAAGIGWKLLSALENQLNQLGIQYIWTWTTAYGGLPFYLKHGYETFVTFENWYSDGSGKCGLKKQLTL